MSNKKNATKDFIKEIRQGRVRTGDMDVRVGPTASLSSFDQLITKQAIERRISQFKQPGAAPNVLINCRED